MVDRKTITDIVIAIIGVSGVVLPVFSTVFINQVYNKPTIDIDIGPKPEDSKQIIDIKNSGTIPATNLSLVITANNHIINNITNLLSTANVFLVNQGRMSLLKINQLNTTNNPVLELHIKKLVNGAGSIIKLGIGAKDTTFKDYIVYATHDQGSSKVEGKHIDDIPPQSIFYLIIVEGAVVWYFLIRSFKRDTRRGFLQTIINEIMEVRRKLLKSGLLERDITLVEQERPDLTWRKYFPYDSEEKNETYKRKTIREVNDYVRIDDFYSKLVDRYSKMQDIDDFTLAELNRQCLELAESALEKIDWSKYR